MLNTFALRSVSGLIALFGLNEAPRFPRVFLRKSGPASKHAVALNGQLFQDAVYDVRSDPQPAPAPQHDLFGVEVSGGSEAARLRANAATRTALNDPQPDPATLRAYSGGGGIGESVDQFYTPAALGALLWDAVTPFVKLDDEKKPVRALEPSCGNGSLLTHAPEGMLLTGVEFDPVAARAAQLLYPHAAVHALPFERYVKRSSDALFDLIVANPPYGPRGETRDLHDEKEVRSERYFMREMLRRTQFQTGLISVLLPVSLLHDSTHQPWREELLRAALPIHAALVPSGAFKEAGAGVTTVVLILRRHDYGVAQALSTLSAELVTSVLTEYAQDAWHRELLTAFAAGEGLIKTTGQEGLWTYKAGMPYSAFCLGSSSTFGVGRYGNPTLDGALNPSTFSAFHKQVADAMKAHPVTFRSVTETIRQQRGDDAARNAEHAAQGAPLHAIAEGTLSDDRRYAFSHGQWVVTDDFAEARVADAVQVAQSLQAYLEARTLARPDAARRRTQALVLDGHYRAQHGAYDRRRFQRLVGRYSLFAVLLAHLNAQGHIELHEETPTRLPITAITLEGVAEQLADLLALTEDTLALYAGCSAEQAVTHLTQHYAFNGELWVEPGVYYVGHAFRAATLARTQAEGNTGHRRAALIRQADLFISKVKRVSLSDLRLSPRDAVIPDAVLEAWVNDHLGSRTDGQALVAVRRENGAVRFRLRGGAGEAGLRVRNNVDTRRARALESYLNHKTEVEAIFKSKDMSKAEYKAQRAQNISEATAYEEQVVAHFGAWLMRSEHGPLIEEAYTQARGAILRPSGSPRPLHLPDWRGKAPHPYQSMDVRAMAAVSGMINNYDVGLGKTLSCLLLIAYLKACGKISRPIISVPAGLVGNWATNACEALPDWRIVTVGMSVARDKAGHTLYKTKRDGTPMLDQNGQRLERWVPDSPEVKRQKIALLSAGNVDLVIMSRESYTSIPMLRGTRDRLIRGDAQYQRNLATQDAMETGRPARGRHAQLVRELGVYGAMLARTKVARPGELSFELLGCDFVAADEAHSLRNLFSPPTTFGETPRFLGGGGESQRALDALHKGRFIRERGGYTFGFTASWVKNSPMEAYSMMSQVTDSLADYGLPTQEALMEQYLRIEPQIITGMDGSVDVKPCVVGFRRLKELKAIISAHVISRTYGDPEVVMQGGRPLQVPVAVAEEVMIDMSAEQTAMYEVLRERARNADPKARGEMHPFSILWEMRKVTVDPALRGLSGRNPRFDKITELALDNRQSGGKGIVFLSIGEREGSFERLRQTLIAGGYPASEIAIVSSHTHKTSVERQDLEDEFNFGDLTLILGTDVLGQGFNLQYGTTLTINADMPWNFEEIRQRVGRAARQGNPAARVRNVYLLMRGSFDAITYTIMSGKKSWLSQLWQDVDELDNTGADFNGEEMALLMSDNPEETRCQIQERKAELEELTGRAGLKRKLSVLSHAFHARDQLRNIRLRASAREKGWTANDHALLSRSKVNYQQALNELQALGPWAFARMLDFQGDVHWCGTLPLHAGMRLRHEGSWLEVTGVQDNVVGVLSDEGQPLALSLYAVMHGTDFQAASDSAVYGAATTLGAPTLSFPQGAAVHVLDARRVNPMPQQIEAVVTVSVRGGEVTLHTDTYREHLRALLVTGHVVMHFMLKAAQGGEHLTIAQVAVLSDDPQTTLASRKACASPKFRARLLEIAGIALGAQIIVDRAHAA